MNMRTLLLALLVVTATLPATALAQEDTRNADVAVETPAGTDAQVSQQRVNGTVQYSTSVTPLELHPQDFAMSEVVDYGVDTPGGTIEQQTDFGQYQFDANASGTYRVYWVVSETVVTNATTGATAERQVRYETLVRIKGEPGVTTLTSGQYQALQQDAQEWRDLNASTLDNLRNYESWYAPEPENTDELLASMSSAYKTQHNIFAMLGGNISTIVLTLVLTLGGLLFLGLVGMYVLGLVRALQKKLNIHRTREQQEGELSDRQRRVDEQERRFAMENEDLQDLPGIAEHEAETLREELGIVSVRDLMELLSGDGPLSDIAVTLDRLHAMGAAGYGCRITPTDDGHDVALLSPGDVPDDADPVTSPDAIEGGTHVDLASMDSDMDELLLAELDQWDADLWREFDMAAADFDRGDVAGDLDSIDVEEIQDALGIDKHRFDDPASLGVALYDLAEHIRLHPTTDGDGSRNPTREAMERLLKTSNLLADKYQSPVHEHRRQAIQRGLQEFDIGERADRAVENVSSGKGVTSD